MDPSEVSQALADALAKEFPNAKLITLHAWSRLPGLVERGYRELALEGDVVLDLRRGANFIFEGFPLNRRRDIRKAMRNGVEVSEAISDADAREYWTVYSAWKGTQRKQIHHDRDFAMLAKIQQMRGNHRRFLARHKGEVVAAAGVRFYPGGLVEYANNCSRDEFLRLCPNDLLVWRMIEWACEGKFPALSMGGAHPFLRKWGGTIMPIRRYRLDRTFLRRVELKEEATAQVRQLIHKLPTPVQTALKAIVRSRAA
jgi:lipid II:glycine glycyltransferase (peptidoglycan interpeptide bridge formation enzyme)